jgi:hypothetical protein
MSNWDRGRRSGRRDHRLSERIFRNRRRASSGSATPDNGAAVGCATAPSPRAASCASATCCIATSSPVADAIIDPNLDTGTDLDPGATATLTAADLGTAATITPADAVAAIAEPDGAANYEAAGATAAAAIEGGTPAACSSSCARDLRAGENYSAGRAVREKQLGTR